MEWIEQARRGIHQMGNQTTVDTDESPISAVTAVPAFRKLQISAGSIVSNGSTRNAHLSETDEASIHRLAHIKETEPAEIAEVPTRCAADPGAHVLRRVDAVPAPQQLSDDRCRCQRCISLAQNCLSLAAWRNEIIASRGRPLRTAFRRRWPFPTKFVPMTRRSIPISRATAIQRRSLTFRVSPMAAKQRRMARLTDDQDTRK
jgi:hypothetical protein